MGVAVADKSNDIRCWKNLPNLVRKTTSKCSTLDNREFNAEIIT
jgi:hypothetical protein